MENKIKLSELALHIKYAKECKEGYKESHEEAIEEANQMLPHGSGIDGKCEINLPSSSENKIIIDLEFHHMDEHGSYDGWTTHSITLTPSFVNGFDMKVSGVNRNDIKDYLVDTFNEYFEA